MTHLPVLLKEVLDLLKVCDGEVYLDATLGEGGHAEAVYRATGGKAIIAGIDADKEQIEVATKRLSALGAQSKFARLNFKNIDQAREVLGIEKPNKILFDLGWSNRQIEDGLKGLSFLRDAVLDMRLGSDAKFTAKDIVNSWSEDNLRTIIEAYGEERFARKIARQIVVQREAGEINTTLQLVEVIKKATPKWYHFKKIHPATRTFQALRIAVNDELRSLREGIEKSFTILNEGGRLAVISFNSLEDRVVKKIFKELGIQGRAKILTKKPIVPSRVEVVSNPRSRSSKLRVIEKVK